ncbi:uncharacterized protein LOC123585331 isoform X2 [Leopardus geoffroyi]|uniref:uncharacterized protein LOC123585331 isoform X2 n=1 Tax=Leopardus geoffroyi TaxID=46844 RepID=UPI001E263C53|nr:uncharacterized protein LOC123585331 isoform X2 [Leopardus geoffroyi]
MASGSAAKRAQGERAAGRHPRPRPSAGLTVCPLVSSHRGGHSTEVAAHRQEGGADKNAEEDSIASNTEMKIRILGQINSECQRLSDKPAPDDSWPTSASQGLDFGTKSMSEKPNKYVPHLSGAVDQKGQVY